MTTTSEHFTLAYESITATLKQGKKGPEFTCGRGSALWYGEHEYLLEKVIYKMDSEVTRSAIDYGKLA